MEAKKSVTLEDNDARSGGSRRRGRAEGAARTLAAGALVAVVGALLAACDDDEPMEPPEPVTYEVTIENLTEGQPLSPGVVVAHEPGAVVWRVGTPSSEGIRSIAEDGVPDPAVQELTGTDGIGAVVATTAPIHRIGGPGPTSLTVEITADPEVDRLSLAVMLICTNDGFAGLDDVALPTGSDPAVYDAMAYDAGTEENTEAFADLPDPCQAAGPVMAEADGNRDDEIDEDGGAPFAHAGIQGGADLTVEDHGWTEPVARVTVTRQ